MDEDIDKRMLLRFPLIVRLNDVEFCGYLKKSDRSYKIHLKYVPDINDYSLQMTEDLKRFGTQIARLGADAGITNVYQYLLQLESIIFSEDVSRNSFEDLTPFYRHVLQEYCEFKNFFIGVHESSLSPDLDEIKIVQLDEKDRRHIATISVDFTKFETPFVLAEYDLPDFGIKTCFEPHNSLIDLYKMYLNVLDSLEMQLVMDVMEEVDNNCWILDPEKPMKRDLYRRIVIDENLSMIVNFNKTDIRYLPDIKFLGPQAAVKKYTEILNNNFSEWDPSEDIVSQLKKLLELESFPQKPTAIHGEEQLVYDDECCICFSLRLGDKLPEIVCSNASCRRLFHADCLYQWLCALNYTKFFHVIHGSCPNCEKEIQCEIPSDAKI